MPLLKKRIIFRQSCWYWFPNNIIWRKEDLVLRWRYLWISPLWVKRNMQWHLYKNDSCTWQGNNHKGKIYFVFSFVLKIHFQFLQAFRKGYISCHGVYVTFFAKIISVRDEKSDLNTKVKRNCSKSQQHYSWNLVLHDRKLIYGSNSIFDLTVIYRKFIPFFICFAILKFLIFSQKKAPLYPAEKSVSR